MIVIEVALGLLAVGVLSAIVRMVKGPDAADRAVAADLVFFAFVAAVALLAVRLEEQALLDIAVVATLVGFLATVALARLVHREER
ncbi:MAG TPA: monovalent cation/H+ antiporter complex subunit F [Jiangellales bacterium]|nr:monovalent cation/H+ antiporter complex subunit F [Jiangellales bacterium]